MRRMERIKCEKMDKIIANMELAERIELRDNPPKAVIKCDKCNKTFKYKSRLSAHQRRKRPCDFILEIKDTDRTDKAKAENRICKYCNRIFASIKYLKTHIKKNCPIAPNEKNGNKGMEILYKQLLDNPEVKNIIIDNSIDNSVTNNINDKSVTNNITININGGENLEFITDEDVTRIYDSVLTAKKIKNIKDGNPQTLNEAVDEILEKSLIAVYNNKLHPENFNMYIPSIKEFIFSKEKKIMTYKEEGWSLEDNKKVYNKITETIIYDLLGVKQPRGPDYINVVNKILRVKEITESMIIPIIEKIKILLDEYGLLPI